MAGTDNIPVDIEFVFKNLNAGKEAQKIKKEIIDVGATTDKVSEQVEANFTEAFTKASAEAAKMNSSFRAGAAGVNQFTRSNNQLSYSIQQVARELPNLAISPQLFIMAISNNLPILQDQLRKTRLENDALRASGVKTVPVFKQVISSILSWQTALVAIITLFTVFGPEIFKAAKNLFSFGEAAKFTKKEQQKLTGEIQKESLALNQLIGKIKNTNTGTKDRAKAIKQVNDKYGDYLDNLLTEKSTLQDIETAQKNATKALIADISIKQNREKLNEIFAGISDNFGKNFSGFIEKFGQTYGVDRISDFVTAINDAVDEQIKTGGGKIERGILEYSNIAKKVYDEFIAEISQKTGYLEYSFKDFQDSFLDFAEFKADKSVFINTLQGMIDSYQGILDGLKTNDKGRTVDVINQEIAALQKLQKEQAKTASEYKNYKNQIDALVKERAAITGEKTGDNNYDEYVNQLKAKEQEYLNYSAALRQYGKEWADSHYELLLKDGASFKKYLENQVTQFKDSRDRMIAIAATAQNAGISLFQNELKPVKAKKSNGIQTSGTMLDTKQLADLTGWYKKLEAQLKKLNKEAKNENMQQVGDGLLDTAYLLDDISGRIGEIDGELGDVIGQMAQVAQDMGNLLTGIATGNPFQAIAGGVGLLTDVYNIFGSPDELSQAVFDRYEALMSTMDDVISKQKELLETMAGSDAVEASEAAIAIINKQIEATQNLGKEYLNSGAGWFSHSHGVELRDDLKKYSSDLRKLGIDFDSLGGRMTGLFELTADKLELIKTELPELWATLDEKTREYLDSIIDSADEIQEINNVLNEQLTNLTFDSARQSLKDLLLDANATMADISDNFQDYMKQAIVGVIIDSTLKDRIQQWYDAFAAAMSNDILTETEKADLQELYESIYQDAAAYRDAAFEAAGIEPDAGGYDAAQGISRSLTEETGSLLVGQFMSIRTDIKSILAAVAQDDEIVQQRLAYLKTIASNTAHNARLVTIEQELKTMNKTLESKL